MNYVLQGKVSPILNVPLRLKSPLLFGSPRYQMLWGCHTDSIVQRSHLADGAKPYNQLVSITMSGGCSFVETSVHIP